MGPLVCQGFFRMIFSYDKGEGGEAAVVAEADFHSERLLPAKHERRSGTEQFIPDRKLPERTIQTTGDLAKELSTDKGGGFPGIFPDIHAVHTLKNPVEIAIGCGRQGMDIVIRHDDPQRQFAPGSDCPAGKARLRHL